MPKYIYTARINPRQVIRADIDAESKQEAVNRLVQMGYCPISVYLDETLNINTKKSRQFGRVPRKDIVIFTRQLSSLIESGVNLLSAFTIIADQTSNKYLKAVLADVVGNIKDGKPLSVSLSAHPALFPPLYTALIHSGEVGGNLDEVLKRLADFMEKQEELKNTVQMSLAYPAFLLFVSIITIIVLLGFVIPRLMIMFEDMGEILPLPTRILIFISSGLRDYWWFILLAISVSGFIWQRFVTSHQGRMIFDKLLLKIPVLGEILLKNELARMLHTLSLLLSSGIAVLNALDIVTSVTQNSLLRDELGKFKGKIASGSSFSMCLSDSKLFPALVTSIVRVGEESGTLEKALGRLVTDYERQVDMALKTLTRLLEPCIILFMGLIVGFIVISMLLPIFQINLTVK